MRAVRVRNDTGVFARGHCVNIHRANYGLYAVMDFEFIITLVSGIIISLVMALTSGALPL